MAEFASISRTELSERRRRLRRLRQLRALQSIWRSLAVISIAGGLIWVSTSPIWVLRRSDQVVIEGNQHLSVKTIQSLLPITYPQSLWAVEPQAITRQLKSRAPIADVIVTRHIFPPRLIVQIQERHPVAIADFSAVSLSSDPPSKIVLLDEEGTWIPLENYTSLSPTVELPTLKVLGMKDQYRSQWKVLYPIVSHSPIQVTIIDWRNPANLILTTSLGTVYLGPYTNRLKEQLQVLDQMRQLPTLMDKRQIAYIDLRNPTSPLVQTLQPANIPLPNSP